MTCEVRQLMASDAEAYRVLRIEGLTLSPASFAIYGQEARALRVDGVFLDEYLMVLRLA